MIKKTVGQVAVELQQKAPETRSPIEIEREAQQDYMKNLFDAVDRGFTEFNDSFFVALSCPFCSSVIQFGEGKMDESKISPPSCAEPKSSLTK